MDFTDRLEINQQQLAKQQHSGQLICHDLARSQEVWGQMKHNRSEARVFPPPPATVGEDGVEYFSLAETSEGAKGFLTKKTLLQHKRLTQ